jgi:hypothetical protein
MIQIPQYLGSILTYYELDHSLPACLPACRYQLTSNTMYYHCGVGKKIG